MADSVNPPEGTSLLRAVVGVGASAGGLQPIERLFKSMPRESGCAFIVVQHLSPDYKSLMDDLLGRQTKIPVIKAETGTRLEPDRIYLPPPGTKVEISDGSLVLVDSAKEARGSTRIDLFFQSLAEAYGNKAVAIVLSGSGGDGSVGVQAVHRAGGFVICQEPDDAQFSSMPESAIQTGCVDVTLPVDKIAEVLRLHIEEPDAVFKSGGLTAEEKEQQEHAEPIKRLFEVLRDHLGINFSDYKESTVGRRILRRVALQESKDIESYLTMVEDNKDELDALYHDLLIGVTEFFRDPDCFEALKEPLRKLMLSKREKDEVRVWVAGCATGQEAYSLAILLDELRQQTKFRGRILIYATDAHRGSLAVASAGVYTREAIGGLSEDRLSSYFEEDASGQFRVMDRYRRMVVFAPHNLLSDPPFMRLDLISCRNVLIYLKSEAQAQVVRSFNYGLNLGAMLFLGNSEGLSHLGEFFEPVDGKAKLFSKTKLVRELPVFSSTHRKNGGTALDLLQRSAGANLLRVDRQLMNAYDAILNRHIPPGLLVTESGEIVHYFGSTERFLGPMSGRPTRDLLARVSGQLKVALMTLLQRVRSGEQRVEYAGVHLGGAQNQTVDLIAEGIYDVPADTRMVHLQFVDQPFISKQKEPEDESEDFPAESQTMRRIEELESELTSTRENLQATIEELQTTNEELQTSNEEMIASNEELQSTNEELQSVNEELYTVNSEYSAKNEQLLALNAEHSALLESLEIGMVFIDRKMQIRKFNRSVSSIIKLLPQDIGRPLDHLATTLVKPALIIEDAKRMFESGEGLQREVRTTDGNYYQQRMYPFAYPSGGVEGAIIAFLDITTAKKTENRLRESERKLELSLQSAEQVWWEWRIPLQSLVTRGVDYCILGYDCIDIDNHEDFWWSRIPQEEVGHVKQSLQEHMNGKSRIWRCEHRYRSKDGVLRWVQESGQVIEWDKDGKPIRMIGVTQLVDERKRVQIELEDSRRLYRSIVEDQTEMISRSSPDFRLTFVNRACASFYGLTEEHLLGRNWIDLIDKDEREKLVRSLQNLNPTNATIKFSHSAQNNKGEQRILEWTNRALFNDQEELVGYQGVGRDLTELRNSQERMRDLLREAETARRKAEAASRAKSDFLAVMNHELRTPLNPIIAGSELLMDTITDSEDRALVDMVHSAGLSLLQLIDSVLDLAKLDAKQAVPVMKPFEPDVFLQGIQQLFRSSIEQKSLYFKVELPDRLPDSLISDANMLRQVLINLLSNAVKFTHNGGVELIASFTRVSVRPDRGLLRVEVRDTGIGIPDAAKETIFTEFSQVDSSATRKFGGAGIGLTISSKLIDVLGGKISYTSKEGEGSSFVVEVPVGIAPSTPRSSEQQLDNAILDGLRDLTLLVVDDEPTNRKVLGAILRPYVKHVDLASEGAMAIEFARKQHYNVVLMDIHMPTMNGFETATSLLQDESVSFKPKVIYVSADTRDAVRTKSAGVHGAAFLSKPLQLQELCQSIVKVCSTPDIEKV